jgi:hypothetical protein
MSRPSSNFERILSCSARSPAVFGDEMFTVT